ncbi:MAG: bifunctional protein-serine/threonine kinase/phosphatase [Gammaproteobacteria bacterium]|nr:bifunctional protein-serine/threonine kinase/phosphatase [Gammaproteobacteria bacterium]
MPNQLKISYGHHTDKGRKKINQDFHDIHIPNEPLLSSKGIAIGLADGISSSNVSQIASKTAITGFLEDYFSTAESWTVNTSVQRVLLATNSWLYSQTRGSQYRYLQDKGYVCTFSSLVLKSNTAHIFSVGDTRIYRLSDNHLEQLTEDHRVWVSKDKNYLQRALGMKDYIDIDYQSLAIEIDDIFILATDGIYEFVNEKFIIETTKEHKDNLNHAAKLILDKAYENGSDDNLTIQIIKIDELPLQNVDEVYQQLTTLPFPPELKPRMIFDGFEVIRNIHFNSRSHIYLAIDTETKEQVIIKAPSVDLREDATYLERFLMEEWVARRINNAHVLKPCLQTRKRNYLYIVTEFIEGKTLSQWMIDNPNPEIEEVRNIIEQISKGLRAFHRLEMLHQDIRPNNIMIDKTGTVKIIDFGSTQVAGLREISSPLSHQNILGTAQYTAPEYFLGETGTSRSDMFSLGIIAYQMLSGRLPYGATIARAQTKSAQRRLIYQSVLDDDRTIPSWIDGAIKKAVNPDPYKRYEEITEFIYDLRYPNKAFLNKTRPPLIERSPVLFWKSLSFILFIIIITLLLTHPNLN